MHFPINILLSFKSYSAPVAVNRSYVEGDPTIKTSLFLGMTSIFQNAFWNIFSIVHEFDFNRKWQSIDGHRLFLQSCWILDSPSTKMSGCEEADYILSCLVYCETEESREYIYKYLNDANLGFSRKLNFLNKSHATEIIKGLKGEFPGHGIIKVSEQLEKYHTVFSIIAAFYFYGWIITLRAERVQVSVDISLSAASSIASPKPFLSQRVRLINLERFFLTPDRSNNVEMRSWCTQLTERYRLRERYERILRVHVAFENHFDNVNKLIQTQKALSLEKIVLVLTTCNVPITALNMFFAINMPNSIYGEWDKVIKHPVTWSLVFISAAIIPLAMAGLSFWARMRKSRL